MNKQELENNLKEIIVLYNNLQSSLHGLLKGVKENCRERDILDELLDALALDKNEETRFAAYDRISNLRENSLKMYLEKSNFSEAEIIERLDISYRFVCVFHSEISAVIISVIASKNLLTPFYLEIFKGVANVGMAFNDFFLPWRNHIVNGINVGLEEKFDNDSDKIMDYLNQNNLFDKGHGGKLADRSYSALVLENGEYTSKAYSEVFEKEIKEIVEEFDIFINKLSVLEDDIYDAKNQYIEYLRALKIALIEKSTNELVTKWSIVDQKWMDIKTPIQISHPLEFYEDKYRKAVAPEWDLRIQNTVFESDVEESITSMYEGFYDEIGRDNFRSSYEFSLANQKRVQLYLSSPVLYYSSELTGMFSAQVVPNDEVISKAEGKKIFAFPEMVLENKKSSPFMKLESVIFEKSLLTQFRESMYSSPEKFYKIYDIETIGHEYGHTLWLDLDTEMHMNKKTGVFKNIEEFKATTGGLVMYFLNENLAPTLQKDLIIHHIIRSVSLLKYKEVNEIEPYYCESLIHLSILFDSEIISINSSKQLELNFTDEIYSNLKENYKTHYKNLIDTYLNKRDALTFLSIYTAKEDGNYYPINKEIRDFLNYYYDSYKSIGNEIDDGVNKEEYM